ncbi:MAG: hypothetical protein ACI9BW_001834 [Gammaproteobacteria bacterium]|jgi:hypothetical protein
MNFGTMITRCCSRVGALRFQGILLDLNADINSWSDNANRANRIGNTVERIPIQ